MAQKQLQVKIGLAILCLGTLTLHAIVRSFPSTPPTSSTFTPQATTQFSTDSNTQCTDHVLLHGSISQLSDAVSNLHHLLASLYPEGQHPSVSPAAPTWAQSQSLSEQQRELSVFMVAGTFIFLTWFIGTLTVLTGLHAISVAHMQRVLLFGLVAANCSLAFMVFMVESLPWYKGLEYVIWSLCAGLFSGVLFGRVPGKAADDKAG